MGAAVFAADEQSSHPVDTLRWIKLAEAVLADEGVRGETEVSLLFVDENAIADLNSRFLGKEGPTDVLAFPIDEEPAESGRSPDSGGTGPGFSVEPEEAPTLLGDVVICPAVAHRNAPDHAGSYEDELALLVVHGLLHLLGLDHEDLDEAEAMEAKERMLLARHHRPRGGRPHMTDPASTAGAVIAAAGATSDSSHHFTGTDVILLVVVVVLIVATGFLAQSETALTRTSRVKALSLVEEKRRGARTLLRLVDHIDTVLPVVLFALQVCTLVAATLVGVVAAHAFGALGVVIATAFEIVVIFVLAELAPKTWAVQHTEQAALRAAPVIRLLVAFKPLGWITRALIAVTNAILPGKGMKSGPYTSDEMLRALADEAAEEGVVEHEERTLIHSIIDFGDTVVHDVMVPRPDMVAVESHARVNDVVDIVIPAGFSRIPVYGQNIDDIVGIVHIKDLVRAERDGRAEDAVSTIMREAHFTPESKKVSELMREMQAGKFHIAIVVDEFGGTAGLATLEDLIEELVGEITDEYDVEEVPPERLDDGTVVVNARMPVDEVNELLDSTEELPEGDEWDTVGGLLYSLLGHVPVEGESAIVDGHRLVAERVQGRRIGRVRICPTAGRLADDAGSADRAAHDSER